jgi:hypothetical protein
MVCYGVFFVAMRSPTVKNLRDRLPEKKKKKPKPESGAVP